MKRSELDTALVTIATWVWGDGEKKMNAMREHAKLSMPELCKTMAIEIFASSIDTRLENMDEDARNTVELVREALCTYHRDGFLEFDPE